VCPGTWSTPRKRRTSGSRTIGRVVPIRIEIVVTPWIQALAGSMRRSPTISGTAAYLDGAKTVLCRPSSASETIIATVEPDHREIVAITTSGSSMPRTPRKIRRIGHLSPRLPAVGAKIRNGIRKAMPRIGLAFSAQPEPSSSIVNTNAKRMKLSLSAPPALETRCPQKLRPRRLRGEEVIGAGGA